MVASGDFNTGFRKAEHSRLQTAETSEMSSGLHIVTPLKTVQGEHKVFP